MESWQKKHRAKTGAGKKRFWRLSFTAALHLEGFILVILKSLNWRIWLPGKPDIAITKYRIAIFCDSSFWHGRDFEKKKPVATNHQYWDAKIKRNMERDKEVNKQLSKPWRSHTQIWRRRHFYHWWYRLYSRGIIEGTQNGILSWREIPKTNHGDYRHLFHEIWWLGWKFLFIGIRETMIVRKYIGFLRMDPGLKLLKKIIL